MTDERDPNQAERIEEQAEDLDVSTEEAEAVKGGSPLSNLMQAQHEMKKAIVQNLRA